MTKCYSDHNEDIRIRGSCDYCKSTELNSEPDPDVCPKCGGEMEIVTSFPINWHGTCEMFLSCEECDYEELVGKDSVL